MINRNLERTLYIAKQAVADARSKILLGSTQKENITLPEIYYNALEMGVRGDEYGTGESGIRVLIREREKDILAINPTLDPMFVRYEAVIWVTSKFSLGNCSELAFQVFHYILLNNVDEKEINAQIYQVRNGDHAFVVLNKGQGSDPKNWNNSVFADAWLGMYYPAFEYENKVLIGCDVFLMPLNSDIYKDSDLKHLYLYKNAQNQIFYQTKGETIFLENEEKRLSKFMKPHIIKKFNLSIEYLVQDRDTIDSITSITANRGHTLLGENFDPKKHIIEPNPAFDLDLHSFRKLRTQIYKDLQFSFLTRANNITNTLDHYKEKILIEIKRLRDKYSETDPKITVLLKKITDISLALTEIENFTQSIINNYSENDYVETHSTYQKDLKKIYNTANRVVLFNEAEKSQLFEYKGDAKKASIMRFFDILTDTESNITASIEETIKNISMNKM